MKNLKEELSFIESSISSIIDKAFSLELSHKNIIDSVHPEFSRSAGNLVHYLALRTFDLKKIQNRINDSGLLGFSNIEDHVLDYLESILSIISSLNGKTRDFRGIKSISADKGRKILKKNTRVLFGKKPEKRNTRIMVTIPSFASDDYDFIKALVKTGMNCARINCAFDNSEIWKKMIDNIKKAEAELGKKCRIMMDLAGPKIRTGIIESFGKKVLLDTKGGSLPAAKAFGKNKKNKMPRNFIFLKEEDSLFLSKEKLPGEDAVYGADNEIIYPARVSCTCPEILDSLKPGENVFFDDGKIEGLVERICSDGVFIKITAAKKGGSKLKQDKGINFPSAEYNISGLTEKDINDLDFIAKHADAVNLSFVNREQDIDMLIKELEKRNSDTGIILKIETKEGFCRLPKLLLTAMKRYPAGVMIARGDLAVEAGWKNFAAAQEEIIRTCFAAHVPVIWATQVLENLAKKGVPTRSEITDAARGHRCECVMLNKGPYILKAVKMLDRILRRMEIFQNKQDVLLPNMKECEYLNLSSRVFE